MSVVLIIGVGEYNGAFLSFGPLLFFIGVKGPVDDGVNLLVIPNHADNHYVPYACSIKFPRLSLALCAGAEN